MATFIEETNSARQKTKTLNELTKKYMADKLDMIVSHNKAIFALSEVDMADMFGLGKENVVNLSAIDGNHSFAQFYLDYNNRRTDETREAEAEILKATARKYNPNYKKTSEESNVVTDILDIVKDTASNLMSTDTLKDLWDLATTSTGNDNPYPHYSKPDEYNRFIYNGEAHESILEIPMDIDSNHFDKNLYSTTINADNGDAVYVALYEGQYAAPSTTDKSIPMLSTNNGGLIYANRNLANPKDITKAAWFPINSSMPEKTRGLSTGTVGNQIRDKVSQYENKTKYSFGFSFSTAFETKNIMTYSSDDFLKEGETRKALRDENNKIHTIVSSINRSTPQFLLKNYNDPTRGTYTEAKSIFKANIVNKLYDSSIKITKDQVDREFYDDKGKISLPRDYSSNLEFVELAQAPKDKKSNIGTPTYDRQKKYFAYMVKKPGVNPNEPNEKRVIADIGASYIYTTPNAKANVSYLLNHESSDFMNNMFTCWLEDSEGHLFDFGGAVKEATNDEDADALNFTFNVTKVTVPLPQQNNESRTFFGRPIALVGGKGQKIDRRATLEMSSDQMLASYGFIYNMISNKRGRMLTRKSAFPTSLNSYINSTSKYSTDTQLNMFVLVWTDNRAANATVGGDVHQSRTKYDNFSELIDSGNLKCIPMNVITFKNVRFEKINDLSFKHSGEAALKHNITFSYEKSIIAPWKITKA